MNKKMMEVSSWIIKAVLVAGVSFLFKRIDHLTEINTRLEERVVVLKERLDSMDKRIERRGWRETQR